MPIRPASPRSCTAISATTVIAPVSGSTRDTRPARSVNQIAPSGPQARSQGVSRPEASVSTSKPAAGLGVLGAACCGVARTTAGDATTPQAVITRMAAGVGVQRVLMIVSSLSYRPAGIRPRSTSESGPVGASRGYPSVQEMGAAALPRACTRPPCARW